MQRKTLITALMAAALAFPLAASAGNDKTSGAKSASANGANDGGAEAMFAGMDKDGDGFLSKAEAAGTPHAADFAALDKNGDGKLSRDEHFAAKEHVAARAKAGATGSTASPTGATSSPSSSSTGAASSKKTY